MRQLGGHSRFPQKALLGFCVLGQLWRQHLEGHQPVEAFVAGQQHDAHTAPTELAVDFVLAGEGGANRRDVAGDGIGG